MKKFVWIAFVLLPFFSFSQSKMFILCEGNFNTPNATLWSLSEDLSQIEGPIHWDPNVNPLGDTGQSLKIHNHKLYIVVNNSNTVEIMDLSAGVQYENTISVPGAGPRELEIVEHKGYLTCWYLHGILVLDIDSQAIIDTILTDGLPEDILYFNDRLYTSLNMNPDWSSANQVLEIDIRSDTPQITNRYEVIPGPGNMIAYDNSIYIASIYYDQSWNSYAGNSKIDLDRDTVYTRDFGSTADFGADLAIYKNRIYRSYKGGIAPLNADLTMDETQIIGNFSGLYSMATIDDYIFLGLTDYVAPDSVVIVDSKGQVIHSYRVGAIPGSFAYYDPDMNSVTHPKKQFTIPKDYRLYPNYPNPFNRTTIIRYHLPKPEFVTLKIYNINGQHIIDLKNITVEAGTHITSWNGLNKFRQPVSAGMYICILQAKDCRRSIPMLFVK